MRRLRHLRQLGQATTEYVLVLAISVSLALILSRQLIRPYLGRAWDSLSKGVEKGFSQNLNKPFFWSK